MIFSLKVVFVLVILYTHFLIHYPRILQCHIAMYTKIEVVTLIKFELALLASSSMIIKKINGIYLNSLNS